MNLNRECTRTRRERDGLFSSSRGADEQRDSDEAADDHGRCAGVHFLLDQRVELAESNKYDMAKA